MKKRILIKVSGASLKGESSSFDLQKIQNLASQVKELSQDYSIGLVVGGGNIFRGNVAKDFDLDRNNADYIGMLATVMNGLLIKNVFLKNAIPTEVYSAISMNKICEEFCIRNVKQALDNDTVCIFVAGTGSPFFTTDSGAALRASEISADMILMGKNGVDGVYDSDPLKNPNAQRFDKLTYSEVLEKNLTIMDHSALTLCKDNNVEIVVFNIDEPNSFVKAMKHEIKTTIISR
ncbi:UMP kinase [Ureaplasma ceti]|uniref:Uridylate kinase n=1 Tax=Ureaplasma ceti TaxID=3119530 RepID=A0ABP9U5U8_9BACT